MAKLKRYNDKVEALGHVLQITIEFYGNEYEGTFFDVTKPDGSTMMMDWTGYENSPTEAELALWIELGYPDRYHPAIHEYKVKNGLNTNYYGALRSEYLKAIAEYEGR